MACNFADGNVSAIGNCIIEFVAGGDFLLAGIIVLLVFAFILWKTRSPASVVLPVGFALIYGLMAWDSTIFGVLYNLALFAIGGTIVLVILKYGRK